MHYRGGRAGPRIQGNLDIQDAIRDLTAKIQIPSTCSTSGPDPDPNSDSDSEEEEKDHTTLLEGIKKMTSHTLIGVIIFKALE